MLELFICLALDMAGRPSQVVTSVALDAFCLSVITHKYTKMLTLPLQVYQPVTDMPALATLMQSYLEDFNSTTTNPMKLVLFKDAMEHISRICRIISQPMGNALLLGVGCSGRRSLARLAAYMCDYETFQVEICKSYGQNEWREVG